MVFKDKDIQAIYGFEDEIRSMSAYYQDQIRLIEIFSSKAISDIVELRESAESHIRLGQRYTKKYGLDEENMKRRKKALEEIAEAAEEKLGEGIERCMARINKYNHHLKMSQNKAYSDAMDEELKTLYRIYWKCGAAQRAKYKAVVKNASQISNKRNSRFDIGYMARKIRMNLTLYMMLTACTMKKIPDADRKATKKFVKDRGYALVYQINRDYIREHTNMQRERPLKQDIGLFTEELKDFMSFYNKKVYANVYK